jgi:hypothetical protein
MNKFIIGLTCVIFLTLCKKKELDPLVDEGDPSVEELNGTNWVQQNFSTGIKIDALLTADDKIFASYLSYSGTAKFSGEYDEYNMITHYHMNAGSGSGYHRIKNLNGTIYGIGLVGQYGASDYDADSEQWDGFTNDGTNFNDMEFLNGNTVIATGFSPYVKINLGSGFQTMGSGLSGKVYVLELYNGTLYAAGEFQSSGSTLISNIAKWNGTDWETVGTGLNGKVYDLEVHQGSLFACGSFQGSGSIGSRYVMEWDGSQWKTMAGGLSGGSNGARTLLSYGDELLIGGQFTGSSTVTSDNIIGWRNELWKSYPIGVSATVGSIAVLNNSVYLANEFSSSNNFFLKLE